MTAATHTPSRTIHPARLTGPRQVTYVCSCAGFTITDTGDEVKRQWAKHLRNVEVEGMSAGEATTLFTTLLANMPNACCNESQRSQCPYDSHSAIEMEAVVWNWLDASLSAAEVDIATAAIEPARFVKRDPLEVGAQHKFRAIRKVIDGFRGGSNL